MKVAVLGGGAFGTALAVALAANGPVTLWARNAAPLLADRQSPKLPGVRLPDAVQVTDNLARAADHKTLLVAVPTQSLRDFMATLPKHADAPSLVLCCKGVDRQTGLGVSDVAKRAEPNWPRAILTGPSFARDIARGLPTALTLACADDAHGKALQHALSTPSLRLYRSTDVVGAELGGALKNVMAIACGACMGAGLGDSARAALMTRGFAEMTRFATHRGARAATLAGLSGLGDLTLTCTSDGSRNYRYGFALGRGESFDASITVEGAATAQAMAQIARHEGLSLPICSATAALVDGTLTVAQAMDQLLSRPLKEE